jgi:dihydrofolate reductase
MGRLIYSAITSLDGYVDDASGGFDWAAPDPEVHEHVNDAERGVSTYLYGRRMYDVMSFWADPPAFDGSDHPLASAARDYAQIWRSADKVVFSTTLDDVAIPNTQLRRSFDPDDVRSLVAAATGDVSVGGPRLATQALAAGLVDEINLYVCPVAVGPGGTSWIGRDVRLVLEQREIRPFASGVTFVSYRVR